ncbi:acyltransferase family protein [Dyadobacter subterraneus]|uniref:Acyltransferase n=1 Tax=Dyadobacter subterraneus TaxID=2773304 RepID=A0ABR9WFM8_9BACT|nr:acyltransferase [Dyadobacter subterraneus]MBE9463131.1 acyltransferase [Dyadobacter subterraneus]
MKKSYLNNLKGLDLLRFFLSVSVIIWHYQHFFYPSIPYSSHDLFLTSQPFFSFFKFFYTDGYYAVQVFWLISGVIFYKIYQDRINDGKITFSQFITNRFSRLYPLHILTLLLTIILQHLYFQRHNSYFIYPHNSVQAFFQHLFFVQAWGDNKSSFNGPTWSVSIEIFVYFIFFCVCASGFIRKAKGLLITFLFFMMIKKWGLIFESDDVSSSIYLFFAGCILIKCFDTLKNNKPAQFLILGILFASWFFTQHVYSLVEPIYSRATGFLDPDLISFSCFIVWGFITIFNLSIFDKVPDKFFQFFGDMTYSTYLTHFPVQIIFYLIIAPTDYKVFYSPVIFISYLISVFVTGRLVFVYFELPVQNRLRILFTKK